LLRGPRPPAGLYAPVFYESAIRFFLHIIGDKQLPAILGSPFDGSPGSFCFGIPRFCGTILILPYTSASVVVYFIAIKTGYSSFILNSTSIIGTEVASGVVFFFAYAFAIAAENY
jgi:hypothetical protein